MALPGIVAFNGERVLRGLRLNRFLLSMRDRAVRDAFAADPVAAMHAGDLSAHECDLITRRDFDGMLEHGASIYAIGKAMTAFGTSLAAIGATSRGQTLDEFLAWRRRGTAG